MGLASNAIAMKEGGGGNTRELEFVTIAQLFIRSVELTNSTDSDFSGFDMQAFKQAMQTTQVKRICDPDDDSIAKKMIEHCPEGEYLPEKNLIQFDTIAWDHKSCIEKMGIVVHEYGRAAGLENGNYKFSSRIPQSRGLTGDCADYDIDKKRQQKY